METGYLRSDDDGHWYLIPASIAGDFDSCMEEIEGKEYLQNEDLFDAFEDRFGQFRCDGYREVECLLPAGWQDDA